MGDATVGALAVSARALPAVPMAPPVDPILTAIARDRIAYVAFAASLTKTDGREAIREKGREVTQTDEDAHEVAGASGRMPLVNLRMRAFGVRGRPRLPSARRSRRSAVRRHPTAAAAPDVYVSSAGSSSHGRNHRVSSFRWLPQIASAPIPNCLDFGWRSRHLQKAVRWRGPA